MKRAMHLIMLIAGLSLVIPAANAQMKTKFEANLAGKNQVPAVQSSATGQAMFQLSPDGKTLSYTLSVKGIDNVTMAHIHMAPMGKDGPPVAWLYGDKMHPATKKGMFSGTLAKGTITAAQLAGPMKGKPLSDLVKTIRDGNAYVNVHTMAHPAGEIRGQIE